MSHLSTERLAALGDEEPTAPEAAHLAACTACARERAAYRTLVAMAHHEREAIGIPLTRWESIAGVLANEHVIAASTPGNIVHSRAGTRTAPARTARFLRMPMRAAAGFLLLAGGAIAGRVSAGASPLPFAGVTSAASSSSAADAGSAAVLARVPDSVSFASVDDARVTQLRSASLYQKAAAFLAQHDTTGADDYNPEVVKSRLAALDQMISTTREAMRQAPHDPVINGYYLTTVGQREATLRQLNTVLPASLRSNSF
jgi:hypothetical protein